jgi:hypothetical protein
MKVVIKEDTIFISIASYRDVVCNSTLKSIYSMAKNPKNVYCGIVQQNNDDEDDDCLLKSTDSILMDNIVIMRLKHYEAKGPCYARYLASTLWSGQEYFIQIDSHTVFVKDWDTKCINMMKRLEEQLGHKKAVISHYPKSIQSVGDNKPTEVTRMCQSFFNERDMISFLGAGITESNNEFYETPYVAGGFLLSKYTILSDVPYDPNLDFLFVGEEIGHSIRIWTSGYNIYTPSENIVYHEYERKGKPKVWDDNKYTDDDAFEKIKKMIGLESNKDLSESIKYNIDKYGLGKERTLEQYYEFSGIDLKNKKVYKNFCKDNNIATEEDIKNSNKTNKENFVQETQNKNSFLKKFIVFFLTTIPFILFILFIIWIIYLNTKNE